MSTTTMLEVQQELAAKLDKDRARLWAARGRRACSEQGPHPGSHLWGARRSKKRTSAPQMGGQPTGVRTALILRSRRSWPVAPVSCARPRSAGVKLVDPPAYQSYVNYTGAMCTNTHNQPRTSREMKLSRTGSLQVETFPRFILSSIYRRCRDSSSVTMTTLRTPSASTSAFMKLICKAKPRNEKVSPSMAISIYDERVAGLDTYQILGPHRGEVKNCNILVVLSKNLANMSKPEHWHGRLALITVGSGTY
ncbi:hypothetical protein CBL_00676 [Carabus blaptoides fortunei]